MLQRFRDIVSPFYLYIMGFLLLMVLAQFIQIKTLKASLKEAKSDAYVSASQVELQNILIDSNKADFIENKKIAEKEIIKIKYKYETIYTNIDSFKGDKNATNCENAYSLLSNAKY